MCLKVTGWVVKIRRSVASDYGLHCFHGRFLPSDFLTINTLGTNIKFLVVCDKYMTVPPENNIRS